MYSLLGRLLNLVSQSGPPHNSSEFVSRLNVAGPKATAPASVKNNTLEIFHFDSQLANKLSTSECADNLPRSLSNVPAPFPMLESKCQGRCRSVLFGQRILIFSPTNAKLACQLLCWPRCTAVTYGSFYFPLPPQQQQTTQVFSLW